MKRLLLPLLILTLIWSTSDLEAQAESKRKVSKLPPVAVFSFAGYNALLEDIKFVGQLSNRPEAEVLLKSFVALATGEKDPPGLDKSRPWGMIVTEEGGDLTTCGFVPVNDFDKFLSLIEKLTGTTKKRQAGIVQLGTETDLYVRHLDGWAFFSDSTNALANVPASPLRLLEGMQEQYDVAVRFYPSNLSETARKEFLKEVKSGFSGFQESLGSDDDDVSEVLKVVDDLGHVTLGWTLDQEAKKAFLDVTVVARKGTELAESAANLKNVTSRFSGFLIPDALLTTRSTGNVPESTVRNSQDVVKLFQDTAIGVQSL